MACAGAEAIRSVGGGKLNPVEDKRVAGSKKAENSCERLAGLSPANTAAHVEKSFAVPPQ
jgi:hypothetical protein